VVSKASNARSGHLFTSESVTMGHPDKIADQISDAVLDAMIAQDKYSRVACETMVKNGMVLVAGEITSKANVSIPDVARQVIKDIGYTDAAMGFDYEHCAIMTNIDRQSPDISQGVSEGQGLHKEQGAGDQGIMFGFACRETRTLMPLPIYLAHRLVERLATMRQSGRLAWLRPDGKSQVTVEYRNNKPARVHTVVLSAQHSEEVVNPKTNNMSDKARQILIQQVVKPVIPARLLDKDTVYHINPTGRFVIGGPHGDCGLTGRKIIVDTYGGRGCHGGGSFSGKDPSKVDRSASYMARYIAKNIVAAGLADCCEVQISYAIGVAEPISILVDTEGTAKIPEDNIVKLIRKHFPLKPRGMIEHLKLLRPIYLQTARHGHFGRELPDFTWEKTDKAALLRREAGLGHKKAVRIKKGGRRK